MVVSQEQANRIEKRSLNACIRSRTCIALLCLKGSHGLNVSLRSSAKQMATTHTIALDCYEDSFTLLALHSPLKDYALAYTLNSTCGLRLKRMKKDLWVCKNQSFSAFEWEDPLNDIHWRLIANKCLVEGEEESPDGFFTGHSSCKTYYFIKEQKQVDYFLKIDTIAEALLMPHLKALNTNPKMIAAYPIAPQFATSKKNVIF